MNGYTADQPITQIFPTLMSMLLFAFASWMIPKMAASIASGTLGTGAADLVGMGAEIGKAAALGVATVAVVRWLATAWRSCWGCSRRRIGGDGNGRRDGRRGGRPRALPPLLVAGEAGSGNRLERQPPVPAAEAAGSPSSPPPPPPPAGAPSETPSAPPAPPSSANNLQSLARHASNVNVPHDGSGHAPSAQLRIEREE